MMPELDRLRKKEEGATPSSAPTIRPEVAAFALLMEKTLRRHDGTKPDWRTAELADLRDGLEEERLEFDIELDADADEAALEEGPDEANYVMMVLDRLGLLKLPEGVTALRIEEVRR